MLTLTYEATINLTLEKCFKQNKLRKIKVKYYFV